MQNKRCSKCKEIKLIHKFYKDKRHKDGLQSSCIECGKVRHKEYYKKNSEKIKERSKYRRENKCLELKEYFKQYYLNNTERIKQYAKQWRLNNPEKKKELDRKYRENNPEKCRELSRRKRAKNPEVYREIIKRSDTKRRRIPKNKLSNRISAAILHSLKGMKNGRHWETIVDFTLQDLIAHLEKQFKDGMNWQNMGKWHIDHIRPIDSFNFTSYDDPEFKECWALTNLQPLWALENIKKGARIK